MATAEALAEALAALLDVQGHDSAVTTLRHLRSHLPAAAAKAETQRQAAAVLADRTATQQTLDEVVARQDALEATIHDLDTRIAELDRRLYGGTVTSSKDLQAIQTDLASMRAHRSHQEDIEMEVLLEREPLDARVADATARLDRFASDIVVHDAEIAAEQERIDAEIAAHEAARAAAVAPIDESLVAVYHRVRAANRGIGIARLEHGTCMACRLKLPAVELDRIRNSSGQTVQCPECSALLVR